MDTDKATDAPAPAFDSSSEPLPSYETAAESRRVTHIYTLDRGSQPWLTLELPSRATKAEDVPYFFGHVPIKGRVHLDLQKPEYIEAIVVEIAGRCLGLEIAPRVIDQTRVDPMLGFLNTATTIWQSSAATRGSSFVDQLLQREGDKVTGKHSIDFSIDLPETVRSKQAEQYGFPVTEFPLPPSFTEAGARAGVWYEITVIIKRGRMSLDDSIVQRFMWNPAVQPPPFFSARRAAYERGIGDLPPVSEDPDGWETCKTVRISGQVFGQRMIEAEYTLSIAKPLAYTRGSVIPLSLLIRCSDDQALDLLGSPTSQAVRLICNLEYALKPKAKQVIHPSTIPKGPVNSTYLAEFRVTQSSTWWIPTHSGDEKLAAGTRRLVGEIHVDPRLKPGFVVPEFKLFYTVGLFAPTAPSFVISDESAKEGGGRRMPLLARGVDITTLYAEDCPRPVAMTPPTYEKGEPWPTLIARFGKDKF